MNNNTTMNNNNNNNNTKVKVVAGYALQQKLGSGSFAIVYKGVKINNNNNNNNNNNDNSTTNTVSSNNNNNNNDIEKDNQNTTCTATENDNNVIVEEVAIKAIDRNSNKLTPKVLHNLEKEITILRTYRHLNIVCLLDVQKTVNHYYLILEYCSGGDLQQLIRTRSTNKLSELLCRRLMRDLCNGLQFLNYYNIIHRDIKPQNLLLTGSLPLDEIYDASNNNELEIQRQRINYPSRLFHLKIADFGFARHLQTTSLAETLCGSPLYMAPEILSHQRYDEKADLWSVGTVLFEMISGKPPFNGDNHIHLLSNIQKNAVRLPPGVRVSKECVHLLRILLNRNPIQRATFTQFVTACNAFVALGCNGTPMTADQGMMMATTVEQQKQPIPSSLRSNDYNNMTTTGPPLGTITEPPEGSESLMTVEDSSMSPYQQQPQPPPDAAIPPPPRQQQHNVITPSFGPIPTPTSTTTTLPMTISSPLAITGQRPSSSSTTTTTTTVGGGILFRPLIPSPPATSGLHPGLLGNQVYTIHEKNNSSAGTGIRSTVAVPKSQSNSLHNSTDDFVMVEYGSSMHQTATTTQSPQEVGIISTVGGNNPNSNNNNYYNTTTMPQDNTNNYYSNNNNNNNRYRLEQSPPTSPAFLFRKGGSSKNVVGAGQTQQQQPMVIPKQPEQQQQQQQRHPAYRGMLSTSPGTGGALMGMLMGRRGNSGGILPSTISATQASAPATTALMMTTTATASGHINIIDYKKQTEQRIRSSTKMLAASEDVGRRAVSVAHLGDHRAVHGIKLFMMMDSIANSTNSSMASSTPMEGIEEEDDDGATGTNRIVATDGAVTDDSSCTEIMASARYRRQRSSLSSVADSIAATGKGEDELDEMPFALQAESPPLLSAGIPSRSSSLLNNKGAAGSCITTGARQPLVVKPTPAMIRSHFSEALLCYVKSLQMIKGACSAVEGVATEVDDLLKLTLTPTTSHLLSSDHIIHLQQMKKRCEITKNWLGTQFTGVLERGDAANFEVRKYPNAVTTPNSTNQSTTSSAAGGGTVEPASVPAVVPIVTCVEELIYNQALALGREGAVKQLLGQNEQARACYRSAGLLAETLLMDTRNVIGEDRKTLEGYVDAFATQISELDTLMQQQQLLQLQSQQLQQNQSRMVSTLVRQMQTPPPTRIGDGSSVLAVLPLAIDPTSPPPISG